MTAPPATAAHDLRHRIAAIETAVQRDVGRHLAPLARHARGGLAGAAASIVAAGQPRVVVLTGCFIPGAAAPAAETDGPPGAALLGAALAACSVPTRLLTDPLCAPVVRGAAAAVDLPVDVCGGEDAELRRLAADYVHAGVTHVVCVERLGPSPDGRVRNMHGEDVTDHTPGLHGLLSLGAWSTIGVGDGGNELGMGKLPPAAFPSATPEAPQIRCVVPCDELIVAGVSNWGALALAVSVGLSRGPRALAQALAWSTPDRHRDVLAATVRAGGVDGVSGVASETVDGLPPAVHAEVLAAMTALVAPGPGGGA